MSRKNFLVNCFHHIIIIFPLSSAICFSVFRNGDDVNPPAKVMLKKFDLWNIVRAKDVIAEKVKPTGGYCKRQVQ